MSARKEPDRLGDALRELSRKARDGKTVPMQFCLREGEVVTIFEVRALRTTKRYIPHGSAAMRRVGGVLCIEPQAFGPGIPSRMLRQKADSK